SGLVVRGQGTRAATVVTRGRAGWVRMAVTVAVAVVAAATAITAAATVARRRRRRRRRAATARTFVLAATRALATGAFVATGTLTATRTLGATVTTRLLGAAARGSTLVVSASAGDGLVPGLSTGLPAPRSAPSTSAAVLPVAGLTHWSRGAAVLPVAGLTHWSRGVGFGGTGSTPRQHLIFMRGHRC
ncbi:unnamed protein product, partial [Ectocarpus sp. 4 AP-2014]